MIDADAIPFRDELKRLSVLDHEKYITARTLEYMLEHAPTITIERDIPKAPTDKQLEEDAYGAWGSLYGSCPNCRGSVYEEQNYCEKCGQRLDWGRDDKAD